MENEQVFLEFTEAEQSIAELTNQILETCAGNTFAISKISLRRAHDYLAQIESSNMPLDSE